MVLTWCWCRCGTDRGRPQGREGAAQGVGAGRGARVRLSPRLLKAVLHYYMCPSSNFQAATADQQLTHSSCSSGQCVHTSKIETPVISNSNIRSLRISSSSGKTKKKRNNASAKVFVFQCSNVQMRHQLCVIIARISIPIQWEKKTENRKL